jgi:hypothetical protein
METTIDISAQITQTLMAWLQKQQTTPLNTTFYFKTADFAFKYGLGSVMLP